MKKADWQYLVDTLLFICIVGIALIGILLGLFLPKGPSVPESSKYFLQLHRHQWGNIHFYLSIAFIVFVIIHLVLSWKWIKTRAKSIFKQRRTAALTSTVLVSLLVLFLFWAVYPREPGTYEHYGVRAGEQSRNQRHSEGRFIQEGISHEGEKRHISVTGKLTLAELAEISGIPFQKILTELGLSSGISGEETLGRLSKKHGFSIDTVRDALARLLRERSGSPESRASHEEKSLEEHEQQLVRGRLAESESGVLITGKMSLREVEEATGVAAREIAARLGLPPDISLDENLGRLKRQYAFSMQSVRDIVASLIEKDPRKD